MENNVIREYFRADHYRLDELLTQYQMTKRSDFQKAKPFFRHFRRGLTRHIIWEEEILFPFFEKISGMPPGTGPTEVMRQEHRLIQKLLEEIHAKVREANPDSDEEEKMLLDTLGAHDLKEENVLYPTIDRLVSNSDAAELFVAMENVPRERWDVCSGHSTEANSVLTR